MSHALTSIGCSADMLRSEPMYSPRFSKRERWSGRVFHMAIEDPGHVIDRRAYVAEDDCPATNQVSCRVL
jgi:hypothetical protein